MTLNIALWTATAFSLCLLVPDVATAQRLDLSVRRNPLTGGFRASTDQRNPLTGQQSKRAVGRDSQGRVKQTAVDRNRFTGDYSRRSARDEGGGRLSTRGFERNGLTGELSRSRGMIDHGNRQSINVKQTYNPLTGKVTQRTSQTAGPAAAPRRP
ncbi:hypothetical protein [Calycomorphotria hydatis]|uniref:Secreted protein n=1 Tax=Calycomorphotria hydatis TaxID=2528027 RepID=A0A517TC79_9PLAN|nr:hypothetical protein [Calycomorphotria hydatis]QDT65985.1 hypothetical protein V22_32490 [Calycomorphotria hydatis]